MKQITILPLLKPFSLAVTKYSDCVNTYETT